MARKSDSRERYLLKMLFREVAKNIDEEQCKRLIDGYFGQQDDEEKGTLKNIVFVLGVGKGGVHSQTAFSCFTVPHDSWKLYPSEPQIVAVITPNNSPSGLPGDPQDVN